MSNDGSTRDEVTMEEIERMHAVLSATHVNAALTARGPVDHSKWLASAYVGWLTKRLSETSNPCYAAEVWLLCRQYGLVVPEEVLRCVDTAAQTGEFFSGRGAGRGQLSHIRQRTREKNVSTWIWQALRLFEQRPRSQAELALELGVDPAEFSRICQSYEDELPWRA